MFQPFHVETAPPDLFDASLRHAERKFGLLSELGARVLVCCSSRTTRGLDDDDLTAEQLHTLAGRAEQRGLRLAYEAVPWGRIRTHEDAWRIVQHVDHPALGLCLDSFHARRDPAPDKNWTQTHSAQRRSAELFVRRVRISSPAHLSRGIQ